MYTGGPRPYGYAGYGELFVFVFFGLVATMGTSYVIAESFGNLSFNSGVMTGLLAVALLVVNNIRDIEGDARSGKRTLAVRLGSERSKRLYVSLFGLVAATIVAATFQDAGAALGLVGLLSALPAIATVRHATTTSDLVRALGMTARVQVVVGLLYAAGLILT
jgi:1,4-dihydroxy-2-naphthoate octaprenyltransferase